ncbi:MAG: ankyrin repeat domain-containing protein, partial [Verrucomicrobia bacterium]|nr:ankyrin repeat domain-containing protein [Verrucomicrobiota bacterium]
ITSMSNPVLLSQTQITRKYYWMPGLSPLLLALGVTLGLVGCGDSKSKKSSSPPPAKDNSKPIIHLVSIPFDIAIQAALSGHAETVSQALATKTDPNQVDENGRTMLMVAAFNGHTPIVKELINAGAKIDPQDLAGRTALMYAATGKNLDTVALLLENKASVDLVDGDEHWTALMFAAAEGNIEVVKLLLESRANPALVDVDGSTAESFASDNGHTAVAELLHGLGK